MSKQLFTIGYEGREIDSFIAFLKNYSISRVLDIRQMPLSRKPYFSKSGLAEKLAQNDIMYVHFKELGSPKPLREGLKATSDYSAFFRKVDKYLETQNKSIEQAYEYVKKDVCCLLCFEQLADFCHRKLVAEKIRKRGGNGLKISHI